MLLTLAGPLLPKTGLLVLVVPWHHRLQCRILTLYCESECSTTACDALVRGLWGTICNAGGTRPEMTRTLTLKVHGVPIARVDFYIFSYLFIGIRLYLFIVQI